MLVATVSHIQVSISFQMNIPYEGIGRTRALLASRMRFAQSIGYLLELNVQITFSLTAACPALTLSHIFIYAAFMLPISSTLGTRTSVSLTPFMYLKYGELLIVTDYSCAKYNKKPPICDIGFLNVFIFITVVTHKRFFSHIEMPAIHLIFDSLTIMH